MLAFDHVILAVDDYDVAAEELYARHGLASVEGGRHVGLGTGNRIIPLTTSYLELMSIVDDEEAAAGPLGLWLKTILEKGEGPAALCLRTTDIQPVAQRLGNEPLAMSRANADGTTLHWRLAGLTEALTQGLPFFIEWEGPTEFFPGRLVAEHEVVPQGIAWVELSGNRKRIQEWVGDHDLDLRLIEGPPGVRRVGIATDGDELMIGR